MSSASSAADSDSDVSSIYKSDDDVIHSFISSPDVQDTNYLSDSADSDNEGAVKGFNKYKDYVEIMHYQLSEASEIQLFPKESGQYLLESNPSLINRLRENYQPSFIYVNQSLRADLEIQPRTVTPPRVLCDAFVVSPFRPVGVFTFLSEDAAAGADNYQAYNSHIAREITSSVRRDGVMNFNLVHGVFDCASYSDASRFQGMLQELQERAYLIGMRSCMDLDMTSCNSVIQTLVKLLFDFRISSCATVAMEIGCRDGNLQLVKDIISVSPDTVNIPTVNGVTPLMQASLGGHYGVVKHLLSHKVDVNVKNNRAETALILACRKPLLYKTLEREKETNITMLGCILAHDLRVQHGTSRDSEIYRDIVELLLSYGADENIVDSDGITSLMLTCIFGDLKITDIFLTRGVNINCIGILDSTAVMWACMLGHDNIVDRLLQAKADVNATSDLKVSPLHISSYLGYYKIVKRLIFNGARNGTSDSDGFTPLYLASQAGFSKVVKLLVCDGTEIDKPDSGGLTPLIGACMSGHSEIAEILISKGVNINHQDKTNTSPLLWSSVAGHTDIVRLLLANSADINTRDVDGRTALMLACAGGWDDIVELLVSQDTDINVTDVDHDTPLIMLCKHVQNIHFWFSSSYAKVWSCFMYSRCNLRYFEFCMTQLVTVCSAKLQSFMLGYAHLTGDTDLLSSLQGVFSDQHTDTPAVMPDGSDTRHDRVLKILLSRGANVNYVNKEGYSALFEACRAGYESGARILLDHNADVNVSNSDGDTALSAASREGHFDIVEMLLDHKADINVTGSDGDTPLIEASREGHPTVVQVLLRHGADINISNDDGETALTVAEEGGHDIVVNLLLKHQAETHTGETTESSVSQSSDQRTESTQPEDKDTARKRVTESGGRNIGQEKKPGINVGSNKEESAIKKKSKKGQTKKHEGARLGFFKSKRVVKAGEILRENLCKVS